MRMPIVCRTASIPLFALLTAGSCAAGPGIWLPPVAQQDGFHIAGTIDTGFRFQHAFGVNKFSMMPSGDETSAVNFRARETLTGNNYVRMKLAMPYKPDTGEMSQGAQNILFNEAFVGIGGNWGEVVMGRLPNIFSGNGDFGLCPQINPSSMGTNFWNSSLAPIFSSGYNFSNAILFNSARVGGFHTAVQYSNGRNGDENPRGETDQLMNVAVTYIGGPWKFAVIAGYYDNDSFALNGVKPNAEKNIAVMGSYWPGNGWSFHAAYQYVRDGRALSGSYYNYFTPVAAGGLGIARSKRGVDAHAGIIGVGKKIGNQKISAVIMGNHVKYMGESAVTGSRDGYRVSPAAIYRYYFSRRTHLWAAASTTYGNGIYKATRNSTLDPAKTVDFGAGLVHKF